MLRALPAEPLDCGIKPVNELRVQRPNLWNGVPADTQQQTRTAPGADSAGVQLHGTAATAAGRLM
jgi:hypothetical protein